jgi:hypothetical protein
MKGYLKEQSLAGWDFKVRTGRNLNLASVRLCRGRQLRCMTSRPFRDTFRPTSAEAVALQSVGRP